MVHGVPWSLSDLPAPSWRASWRSGRSPPLARSGCSTRDVDAVLPGRRCLPAGPSAPRRRTVRPLRASARRADDRDRASRNGQRLRGDGGVDAPPQGSGSRVLDCRGCWYGRLHHVPGPQRARLRRCTVARSQDITRAGTSATDSGCWSEWLGCRSNGPAHGDRRGRDAWFWATSMFDGARSCYLVSASLRERGRTGEHEHPTDVYLARNVHPVRYATHDCSDGPARWPRSSQS